MIPETRNAVITRDKGLCVNCGGKGQEVHHLLPNTKLNEKLYSGKINSMENLVYVCHDCHEKHSLWDTPLRAELKAKWEVNSKLNKKQNG